MRTINSFILLCVFCLFCQPTLAQRRVRLADLPPFERAVVVVKYFEGMHSWTGRIIRMLAMVISCNQESISQRI